MRAALTIFLLSMIACGGKETASSTTTTASQPATTAASSITPEELGELGAKIRKEPGRANELLREKGLNQQTFETAIRDDTEDPAASKRYAAAYEKATG